MPTPALRLVVSFIFVAISNYAYARTTPTELPDSRTVTFLVHTGQDESSSIRVEVRVDLIPQKREQNDVSWKVDRVRIIETSSESQTVRSWSITSPALSTSDGLWTVHHANPLKPDASEFVVSPQLAGVGDPESGTSQSLTIELASNNASPTEPSAFALPASLQLIGTSASEQTIIFVDEDEPTEVDDGDTQPTGNQ